MRGSLLIQGENMIIQSSLLSVALVLATASCARDDHGTAQASNSTNSTVGANADRTAMSQSNERTDLDHLAEIRKSLVADDSLSTAAKNVQVLTKDGTVLLRGKVTSTLEREAVEGHARTCTATRTVDNQIEVEKS